jgi:ATP-dependent DNA ligase
MPHINKHLEELELPYPTELDGELYKHKMPHEEIRSRVSRTVDIHPNHEVIEYHIFDRINEASQTARLEELKLLTIFLSLNRKIRLIQSREVFSLEEVEVYLNQCMEKGYEGIILRHSTAPYKRSAPGHATCIMKLKPRVEGVYDIVGFEEEHTIHGEPKNALGALVLALLHTDRAFKVGTGFTRPQREDYWLNRKQVLKKRARIRYQSLTEDRGVPKMSSFVRLED